MTIRIGLQPGDIGYIIYLHGVLYAREYALDRTFEGDVAIRMGEFAKIYDSRKDYFAVAELDGKIVGCIVINDCQTKTHSSGGFWFTRTCEAAASVINS